MNPSAQQSSQAPTSKGGGSTRGTGIPTWMISNLVLSLGLSLPEFIFSRAPATTLQSKQTPVCPCLGVNTGLRGALERGAGCPADVPGSQEGGTAAAQAEQQQGDIGRSE